MNITQERADFEAFASKHGLCVTEDGDLYRSHVVAWMWKAWQARAAIEADRKRSEPVASPAQSDDFDAQQRRIEKSMRAGARLTDHRFKLDAPQPVEPRDSLPSHAAQTLATAIYEAAQKVGIANGDHSALSVPQCLHLLDCMTQLAEPVKVPSDAEVGQVLKEVLHNSPYGVHQWELWLEFASALFTRYGVGTP